MKHDRSVCLFLAEFVREVLRVLFRVHPDARVRPNEVLVALPETTRFEPYRPAADMEEILRIFGDIIEDFWRIFEEYWRIFEDFCRIFGEFWKF